MHQFAVTQKAIIQNEEGKILTIFRTETAPSRPNTWDLPGGEVDFGENPQDGIKREILEETGLEVEDIRPFDIEVHLFPEEGVYWLTIAYKCRAVSSKIKLSYEHNDYKWVTPGEFLELESSPRFKNFIKSFSEPANLKDNKPCPYCGRR